MKKILVLFTAILMAAPMLKAQEETNSPKEIQLILCSDISNEKCKPIGESSEFKLTNSQVSFFVIIRLTEVLPTEKLYLRLIRNGKTEKPYYNDWLSNYEQGKIDPCLNTNVVIKHPGDYTISIMDEDQRQEFSRKSFSVGGMKGVNAF